VIRRRRLLLLPALLVLSLAALVAVPGAQSKTDAKPTGKPIVIGGAIALSGGFSAYDLINKVAAQVAVNDINAAGGVLGRPLQYIPEDTKSDLSVGPTVALDLINKGAVALITQCDFDYGSPAALVAQKHQIPAFSCASSPKFGAQDLGPYAYDVSPTTNEEGGIMATYAYNTLHARTAYFLTDTSLAYSTDECKSFMQAWQGLPGTSIVGKDTFSNGDPSIASQITRIKSLKTPPQVIGLCTYLPGGPNAIRQIRAAGITAPMFSGVGIESRDWFKALPTLSDYYYLGYGSLFGNDPRPAVNKFFKMVQALGHKPAAVSLSLMAYTEVQLIADAIKKAGSTSGPALVKALNSFTNVPTITGPVTYTATKHYNYFPVVINEIEHGKVILKGLVQPPKKVPAPTF